MVTKTENCTCSKKIQNKFLRIILNEVYDTLIGVLHTLANIQTIQDCITNSFETVYYPKHLNSLIKQTKNNKVNDTPLKIMKRNPKHVIDTT